MDSVQFLVAAKYFEFHHKNVMDAKQMNGGDEDSRHSRANLSGLHHNNQNFMYMVAIIFSNKGVNRWPAGSQISGARPSGALASPNRSNAYKDRFRYADTSSS